MHNLCVFCTFSTFAQKIFKGWGCNCIWSFGKVMHSKLMKMVFVARIIRHKLCMIWFFLVQNLFLTKNYLLTTEIYLTTRSPLYTCLVSFSFLYDGLGQKNTTTGGLSKFRKGDKLGDSEWILPFWTLSLSKVVYINHLYPSTC